MSLASRSVGPDTTRPEAPRTRSSSLDFIQQKLRRLTVRSSVRNHESEASLKKGPLGLNALYQPSDPHIDFIFVRIEENMELFAGTGHVLAERLAAERAGNGSRLSVHDFGQALLADIYNCPALRKHGDTPIVLVAHSMGGLVAKKAYLLATRDPTYHAIARRIHTMYFLATPHRGADSAQFAKLARHPAIYGPKDFVGDLLPGSGTLDQINDEFRHVCGQLHLWSFFEGAEMSFGFMSTMVVNKDSAVIGLPREHVQYMEADHRQICKFSSPTDPNYLIMQRCFLNTIEELEVDVSFQRRDENRSQMKMVSSLLRVDQRPDAILLATNQKQQQGSCKWLTSDDVFQQWLDDWQDVEPLAMACPDSSSRLMWLNGRPGTGKSVAAGHVIRYLEGCNLDCSFYFFRHDNKAASTVSHLLRSLAYQMAESNFDIRRCLISMAQDEVKLNLDDYHMVWRTLFVDRILRLDTVRPHFWVIDAVDECSSKDLPALISMISSLSDPASNKMIRVLIASRPGGQVERLLNLEHTQFFELNTGQDGSLKDIELYLAARCPQASYTGPYRDLVADVLSKSNGIFLWASLTMARLEDTYSVEDMQDILRQMPTEMDAFYSRITASIAATPSSDLAKCILKWAICSPRPLTFQELADAVKMDIGRTLTASAGQLESITGHLIFVDSQARIHITHQTTAAFLTQQREEFWIDRSASHTRIAEICLTILCGSEFTPPRTRRGSGMPRSTAESALADYAAANFAYHLMHGTSASDPPLMLLNKFLRSNVLTWIERTISTDGLAPLQHTAQRLAAYMRRRAKYQPPVSVEIQTASGWVTDISHIVAVFHSCLLLSPSSIHFLVPHFCPPDSIIRTLFAKPSKRLRITGTSEETWSDRLTCYPFSEEASSIACCDGLLAVGLHNGEVQVYNCAGSGTFASVAKLDHGKRIRQLGFNHAGSRLFSCSARKLKLWEIQHSKGSRITCLWSQNLDFTPSEVSFSPDGARLTVTDPQGSALVTVKVSDGTRVESIPLHGSSDSDSSDGSDEQTASWTPATRIRLDPTHKLAAASPEGFESAYASPTALDMIFNPIQDIGLLAISYKDGDIVTVDPGTLEQQGKYHLSVSLVALAASSNGRVLAGGAEDGSIHLFYFEMVVPFYHIAALDEHTLISSITFSADNLRLFDTRGQCCNVWEPFALVQKDRLDDSSSESHSDETSSPEPLAPQAHVFRWGEAITVLEQTADGKYIFAGRQNGTIEVYEVSTGETIDKLPLHGSFAEIQHMDWNEDHKLLLSADTTGRCILTRVSFSAKDGKPQTTNIMDHRESSPIRQALLSPSATLFLIRTDTAVRLIDMQGNIVTQDTPTSKITYMPHPSNNTQLMSMQLGYIHFHDWSSLRRLSPSEGTSFSGATPLQETWDVPWTGRHGSNYLAGASKLHSRTGSFAAIKLADLTPGAKELPLQTREFRSAGINAVLGVLRSSLYFLERTGWVCSIGLKNLSDAKHYTRHFFIPPTWRTGADVVARILSKTAVAFARGEHLVVFHGFLEFEEMVPLE